MADCAPLDTLLDQCERIVQVHEQLRMDTPGDEALRMDVVATARAALDQCHEIAARTRVAPGRAAALRDVETLTASVTNVDDRGMFFLADDERREFLTASEFAALIVDRVLGAEQNGGATSS